MKNDIRLSSTNKEQTIENIMNSFSAMYLTMISIVQGVALGILFYKISALYSEWVKFPDIFSTFSLLYILLTVITTFLFIILTWHSYFWLAAIARWVPLIWDSILFFILGAFEFILIESLSCYNTLAWIYIFSIVGIIGGIQYIYNSIRLFDREPEDKKEKDKSILNKAEDKFSKWLEMGLKNIFNFLVKEKPEMNVWGEGTGDLGAHISDYKEKRGYKLIFRSLVIVIFVIGLNIFTSIRTNLYTEIIKFVFAFIILVFHLIVIWSHLVDQQESIRLIKMKAKPTGNKN